MKSTSERMKDWADESREAAQIDGSVIVERSAGEVSARSHDEEANLLALNLMEARDPDHRVLSDDLHAAIEEGQWRDGQ